MKLLLNWLQNIYLCQSWPFLQVVFGSAVLWLEKDHNQCGSALCSTHDALFISSFDRCFYYCSFCFTRISLLKIKGGAQSEEWTGNCGLDKSVFKLRLLQLWRNGIRGWCLSRAHSFHIWTFTFVSVTLPFFRQTLLRLKLFLEVGR